MLSSPASEPTHHTPGDWPIPVEQAEEYLRELQSAIERVAANPRIGRACDEIRPGYRKSSVGSHTLFYRVTAEGIVDVVRVLHQRMVTERQL